MHHFSSRYPLLWISLSFLLSFSLSFLLSFLLVLAAASALSGCAVGEPASDPDALAAPYEDLPAGVIAHVLQPKPPRELAAELGDLSLWISPIVQIERLGGGADGQPGPAVWRVDGRASAPLGSVASWVPDDAFGEARLTGPMSFSITLRERADQSTLASGTPLFLTVWPAGGRRAEAAIWFRPRLVDEGGSGRLRWQTAIAPVWVEGDVEYRGAVTVAAGWSLLPEPPMAMRSGSRGEALRPVWTFAELARALSAPAPQLLARARRGDEGVSRAAKVELRATRLGITREDPRQVWPVVCELPVRACLEALPDDHADVEACGTYRQVLACGGRQPRPWPLPAGEAL